VERGGRFADQAVPRTRAGRWRAAALSALAGLLFGIVLWGGYSHRWPWTGINGATATLWDWLHLLLLPVVFAVLPTWMRRDTRMDPRVKRPALVALALFSLLVLTGYLVPWAWTGFRGNTLWDWLNLVVLPVALLLTPRFVELRAGWHRRHSQLACLGVIVLGAMIAGGYLAKWAWTGFTGNTFWDWLHLLLLPALLPTVVAPALTPLLLGRIVYLDESGRPVSSPRGEDLGSEPAPASAR
jgi:MFS family permease